MKREPVLVVATPIERARALMDKIEQRPAQHAERARGAIEAGDRETAEAEWELAYEWDDVRQTIESLLRIIDQGALKVSALMDDQPKVNNLFQGLATGVFLDV